MEAVSAVIGAVLAEPSKIISASIHARIKNFRNRQSNFKALQDETNTLIQLKDRVASKLRVQEQTERERLQAQVGVWVNQVNELEEQVKVMKTSVSTGDDDANYDLSCSCSVFPKLCKLSNQLVKRMAKVKQLQEDGKSFEGQMSVPNQLIPVEHIPGPSITGQKTASENLTKLLDKLKDDKVSRIGVYGMGGIGKSTLVLNLNNKLKEEPSAHGFSIIIWVTVSRDTNPRKIQTRIFERLELVVKDDESDVRVTSRLHDRLKTEECFLLILDDVWEDIDLQELGIPNPEECPRSKILITSRLVDVCRRMSTEDAIIMVGALNHEEAWDLFQKHAGEVAGKSEIQAVAKEVEMECAGLPLALITVGASMKGKSDVRLWKNARTKLRKSAPDLKGINIEEKVFKTLKWSYDSLPDESTRSCFLFCCLYPEDYDISMEELVRYWYCEGLFDEQYEEKENEGIEILQCLRDCCLLEEGRGSDTIKVHDVVRDVGIWIARSNEHECRSLVRSGIQLTCVKKEEFSHSYKRVSFMNNQIHSLPDGGVQCPDVSTLLLQRNPTLEIIPISFLEGFESLKILDLSYSMIESLPSLAGLNQLRALILQGCKHLKELPALDGLSGLLVLDCSGACITQFPYVSISSLHKLEYLDLSLDKRTPLERQGIFEAVLPLLEHLTVFHACLDGFPLGSKHLNSLERCKEISLAFPWENLYKTSISVKCDQYVSLKGGLNSIEWPIELIEWSLPKAPQLKIENCDIVSALKKLSVNGRRCFSSVKVLRLHGTAVDLKGDDSSGASFDLLPNLEEIDLRQVYGVESISDLGNIIGLSFSRLRSIEIRDCVRLKCVFALKENQKLEKLQDMIVMDCDELEWLFQYPQDMGVVVPNLQRVSLNFLPRLEDLCINCTESGENLKLLEVIDCDGIRKVPLEAQNAEEIRGKAEWWNQLEWDSEDTKLLLHNRFKQIKW